VAGTHAIVKTLPPISILDLVRSTGLTASDYTALMHLSEAPNRELRMADLAEATGCQRAGQRDWWATSSHAAW